MFEIQKNFCQAETLGNLAIKELLSHVNLVMKSNMVLVMKRIGKVIVSQLILIHVNKNSELWIA